MAVDVLVAAAATFVLVRGSREALAEQATARPLDGITYAVLAAAGVAFVLRRRAPLALLAAETVAAGVYLGRGHSFGPVMFAVAVAAYGMAVRHERREVVTASVAAAGIVVGAALAGALAAGGGVAGPPTGWLWWVVTCAQGAWVGVPAVVGSSMRSSRLSAVRAEQEAQRRRREQERLQLAREVHDVVGHSLSVISLQAGVALHVLGRQPEQAQPALEAIRRTSAEALDELRSTLSLTRADADEAPRVPVAGLSRLPALVEQVRQCALPVQVACAGVPRPLPAEVDQTAFRVVQESLTNVLRHAGAAAAVVRVTYEPEQVRVAVDDDGAGPLDNCAEGGLGPRGHGLVGLQERAAALGGRFSAGPAAGGGWHVEAVLPAPEGDLGREREPAR